MEKVCSNFKKKLGFGFMRLPTKEDGSIDFDTTSKMVDLFIENGFNYFDTAHGYMSEKSEVAINKCLTSRYPRDKYILTDKLSQNFFSKEEDIIPLFNEQLKICGVDYFDIYLMHAQNKDNFKQYVRCKAYETAFKLKDEGKIRHVGISFHDSSDVLEDILTKYPQIEIVQLQFNYLDYEDSAVQSKKCYEVCARHNIPCLIMEPVKGGRLVNLPDEAQKVFDELKGGSNASYALRFAAGFENNKMVLSGMSNIDQIKENIETMKDFKPLNEKETEAINKVVKIFKDARLISCTSCRYCVDGCPKNILIPDLFACLNAKKLHGDWNSNFYYRIHTQNHGKASDCIKCGKCENICPQHLKIRDLLVQAKEEFE